MIITAIFKDQGAPAVGLTPAIDIWDVVAGTKVVSAAAMTAIGGGIYKYDFATFDPLKEYATVCDGGPGLNVVDRYATGGTTTEGQIDQILEDTAEVQGDLTDGGRLDVLFDGVKERTDRLPDDPASQSGVAQAILASEGNIRDGVETLQTIRNTADGIKQDVEAAKTLIVGDVESAKVAVAGDIEAARVSIMGDAETTKVSIKQDIAAAQASLDHEISGLAAIRSAVDVVDLLSDAIKERTDRLPDDPASESNVTGVRTKTDNLPVNAAATLDAIDARVVGSRDAVVALLEDAAFGLAALKALLDAVDTNDESAARFAEIKGAGWATQTLAQINALIDGIKVKTDELPDDSAAQIAAVRERTDRLPDDPASENNVTGVRAKTDFLPTNTAQELDDIDAVLADLDADVVQLGMEVAADQSATHALLQDAAFGLAALRSLLDAINLSTTDGVTAQLDAIKGEGWTTETLVQLDALLDAIKEKTDFFPANTAQELDDIDGQIAAVRERTDRLPDDPASQSENQIALDAAETRLKDDLADAESRLKSDLDDLAGVNDWQSISLGVIQGHSAAIREKTDALPINTATRLTQILTAVNGISAVMAAGATAAEVQAIIEGLKAELEGLLGKVQEDVSFIRDIEGGRWRIVGTQMVFYKEDNITEVARFNLLDADGGESAVNVFERRRA